MAAALAKNKLRQHMLQKLSQLTSAQVHSESEKVHLYVKEHPQYQSAQNLSIYISMDSGELQTKSLIRHALDAGKTVYVPRCDGSIMDMVKLDGIQDLDTLPKNRWGIPEPSKDRSPVDPQVLDFIVVPGVAFDSYGNRCGHGKGYYDKYLIQAKHAFTCAVCLNEQVLDTAVPIDSHDQKPHTIITPSGILFSRQDKEKRNFP